MDKEKIVRPWDLLNPHAEHVPEDVYVKRYETCLSCKSYNRIMKVCMHCLCVMKLKCSLSDAFCPEDKWEAYQENQGEK
jgi:hypothetical protein